MKKEKLRKIINKLNFGLIILSSLVLISNRIIIVKKEGSEKKILDNIKNSISSIPTSNDYIGILEIPKISLRKGLVRINSKSNNVDYNVQVLLNDISTIESKSIILAGHSGSGYKAFFKNIDKLEKGDCANIYYNNKNYNYIVNDIYILEKDGNIEIPSDNDLLILTTCYKENKQLVVILKKYV